MYTYLSNSTGNSKKIREVFMQSPLPKSIGILALFLAVPVLCLAWTADTENNSERFCYFAAASPLPKYPAFAYGVLSSRDNVTDVFTLKLTE